MPKHSTIAALAHAPVRRPRLGRRGRVLTMSAVKWLSGYRSCRPRAEPPPRFCSPTRHVTLNIVSASCARASPGLASRTSRTLLCRAGWPRILYGVLVGCDEIETDLIEIGPNIVELALVPGQIWRDSGDKAGRNRPMLVEFGPNSVNFAPDVIDAGPTLVEFD